MLNIERLEGESDDSLLFRVGNLKDSLGVSWDELAVELNKLTKKNLSESSYRKRYKKLKNKFSNKDNASFFTDKQLRDLEKKEEKLRKERIKLQTANLERSRIDRAEARQELYYEYIGKYIDSIEPPHFEEIILTENNEDVEYLQCIADIHYGASFTSEHNEYSPEIAKDRFDFLADKTIDFIKKKKLSKIHILELSDTVQGLIHLSDLKLNDTSLVKSVVDVSRLIAKYLTALSVYTNVEYYHVPNANHTQLRVLGMRANENPQEDLEYIVSHYIKDLVSGNDRIHVHLAEENHSYIELNVGCNEIIAMHGHNLKKLDSVLDKISGFTGNQYDYVITGHYHSGREIISGERGLGDRELLIAPSFIGSDPYSDSLMLGSRASVKIFGFDEIYGHTESYKFILN